MMRDAAIEPPEPGDAADLLPPRSASQRVLIVEDEKRLREMLHTSITEMGLQPTSAPSAEAALKLMNQQFFALAVLDLNLPGMNGLELCERLHQQKPHIQVILLTGFGDLDAARQAIRLEVVDFLTKPCGMDDLENALNRARLRWLDRWATEPVTAPPIEVSVPATAVMIDSSAPAIDPQSQRSMEDMEREMIVASLARHAGNRQAAAIELGISVRKLYYRLQQYQRAERLQSDE
jgi:DNA-binding NtrC family response regulator